MHIDRSRRFSGVRTGVLEALRAHVLIRRAEAVDVDDLPYEVEKWRDGDGRVDSSDEPLATVRARTRAASPGGRA